MKTGAVACAVALAGLARGAHADDAKDTADTVASTWTGGAIRLAEEDKRFLFAITSLFEGVRVRAEMSAPLDDETRTASFVNSDGVAPGFKAAFYIGYDSAYRAAALTSPMEAADLLRGCRDHGISEDDCNEQALTKKLRQRDGQPLVRDGRYYGLGLDVSVAYDRASAYQDDIAADTTTFSSSDLQVGLMATVYGGGTWAASFRAGAARTDPVELTAFRRCRTVNSSDPAVTGESCQDAKLLQNDGEADVSGYARLSVATYPHEGLLAQYISAAELRLNAESLGQDDASFDTHLLVFARGLAAASGSVRTGIGLTVRTAISAPEGADYEKGDIYDYALFGIVGTSF